MKRVMVRFLLAVAVLAVCAQALAGAPAQFEAIERYATLINEGAKAPLRSMFTRGVLYAQQALYWSEERGTAALPPL